MSTVDFYEFHWEQKGGLLKDDPYIQEKINLVLKIIPEEVETIADIGCGDGAITNELAKYNYIVTGIDQSEKALGHLSTDVKTIMSDAGSIPLKENSIDLIFSSQMLEHLDDSTFIQAVNEIKRIANRYILITVPNNEDLRKRYAKCINCGTEFHLYGHLRSFTVKRLSKLFPGYSLRVQTVCGFLEEQSFRFTSYLKNKLSNNYFYVDSIATKCPSCDQIITPNTKNFGHKIIVLLLSAIQRGLKILLNKKPRPDWLVVLFEKLQ